MSRSVTCLRGELVLLLSVCGCLCQPPDGQPGDCVSSSGSSPLVVLGGGADGFLPIVEGDALPLVHGTQGGSHVWMAVRAGGLKLPVSIALEATDAFTGEIVASGFEQPPLNAAPGPDGLECERHRLYLYLEGDVGQGAGLVDVAVTVTDAAGHSAADARRVWLGQKMPACLPGEAPTLTPLSVTTPWWVGAHDEAIGQDARLQALDPNEPRRFLFGAATRDLAGSAVTLDVSLLDPEDPAQPLASGRADGQTDAWWGRPQGEGDDCYLPLTVALELPGGWQNRPVLLRVVGDDGLGGRVESRTRVTLAPADTP